MDLKRVWKGKLNENLMEYNGKMEWKGGWKLIFNSIQNKKYNVI